ncbi:MAG: CBS domain-containing protein [Rhodospirillaceae bacterium]|jgi:CBS domain-containing protein|nr:CBS domain-containing protein [Rhodospirillaceae bacterium]MBT4589185.1 CBS domain-containing protein [Rhodospirillaceae bacterium]MBT4940438.1 CBS domain-containing protein [Rhodospirillaceae bacterium]MBT5941748.1 CBS domain-containing protein [Rhodospirillaceae bacterium]MBT7265677.1 CBS domain-containing protein [Rhodospirillaceae bacterium]
MSISVGEILDKKGSEVIAISSESTIPEAARLMSHRKIGLLIVLNDKNKFVGVLSERDIVRAVAIDPDSVGEMHVGRLITRNVIACDPQAVAKDIIDVMNEKGFRHMPVVKDGNVKGVVSRTDLMMHS